MWTGVLFVTVSRQRRSWRLEGEQGLSYDFDIFTVKISDLHHKILQLSNSNVTIWGQFPSSSLVTLMHQLVQRKLCRSLLMKLSVTYMLIRMSCNLQWSIYWWIYSWQFSGLGIFSVCVMLVLWCYNSSDWLICGMIIFLFLWKHADLPCFRSKETMEVTDPQLWRRRWRRVYRTPGRCPRPTWTYPLLRSPGRWRWWSQQCWPESSSCTSPWSETSGKCSPPHIYWHRYHRRSFWGGREAGREIIGPVVLFSYCCYWLSECRRADVAWNWTTWWTLGESDCYKPKWSSAFCVSPA